MLAMISGSKDLSDMPPQIKMILWSSMGTGPMVWMATSRFTPRAGMILLKSRSQHLIAYDFEAAKISPGTVQTMTWYMAVPAGWNPIFLRISYKRFGADHIIFTSNVCQILLLFLGFTSGLSFCQYSFLVFPFTLCGWKLDSISLNSIYPLNRVQKLLILFLQAE